MEAFIQAYKTEHKSAQKDGRIDEQEADPIVASLFCYICSWAVAAGDVFLWVYCPAVWNLMARSVSMDCLGFHHSKSETLDSIKCRFDETKADKTGEFVQEKKYANPYKPELCFFLALGCHISLNAERLGETKIIFLDPGSNLGTASAQFCTQLAQLVIKHHEIARQYLRTSHCNGHSIRKGSGSYASSATTKPSLFVATAARGEWLIEKVHDVYFKFGMGGNQYLGRLFAFLDPNNSSFVVLPPHWKDLTRPTVVRGLQICFREILETHGNESHGYTGLLLLLLASIVHHSAWITSVCLKYPGHPFHGLALLDKHELLDELKGEHLTLEPTQHVPLATGVPPHIDHSIALKKVFDLCTHIDLKVDSFNETLRGSVFKVIDLKVKTEGGVNSAILLKSLDQLKDELFCRIDVLGESVQEHHLRTKP